MKKRKLLLPLILVLVLSLVFSVGAQDKADTMTVYVDQAKGADTNDGLSEATAVATMDQAYALLREGLSDSGTGTIVLVSNYTREGGGTASFVSADAHSFFVTIQGKTPDIQLCFAHSNKQAYITMNGPTTFANLTLSQSGTNKYVSLHGSGYFVIGQSVTVLPSGTYPISLSAAPKSTGAPLETYLEINSGDWRNVYAAGYAANREGTATFVMNGGSCEKLGAVYSHAYTGDVHMTMNGGQIDVFYPHSMNTGDIKGDMTVTFTGTYPDSIESIEEENHVGKTYFDLAPNGLTLPSGEHTVRNVSAGAMSMAPGASLNVTGSVTGTVKVTFTGTPEAGQTVVTAPEATADNAFDFGTQAMTITAENGSKIWRYAGESAFNGLVLTAQKGFSVTLYRGLSGSTKITPTETVEEDGLVKYYFENLASGAYRTKVLRTGYFTVIKAHYFTDAQMAVQTVVDVSTSPRGADGPVDPMPAFQPTGTVYEFSDGLMEKVLVSDSSAAWWNAYSQYLNTPYFTIPRAQHQATTQQEMEAYIADLDKAGDNMYIYSLGVSDVKKQNIPVVLFTTTDLSGADTLEDAAALVCANDKINVHIQTNIHGNEPASAEAVLAFIGRMQTEYGTALLENMNIYVIPSLNPDGAYNFNRENGNEININRDMLLARSGESALHHKIYQMFLPELAIDCHEYSVSIDNEEAACTDIMIAGGSNGNSGSEFIAMTEEIIRTPFAPMVENDLTIRYYTNNTNGQYSATGRNYRGMLGGISILVESHGLGMGMAAAERRVTSHLVTLEAILDFASKNHQQIKSVTANERQSIIDSGKTYEETDTVVLKHKKQTRTDLAYTTKTVSYLTGETVNAVYSPKTQTYVADVVRPRPTAYVIPAGLPWTEGVLEVMDRNGITYYYAEPGTTYLLQQYTGTIEEAELTEEQNVTFGKGAYVLPMNQVGGTVLALLMEPDLADENKAGEDCGTLAEMGYIPLYSNGFPIYRYIHNLNGEGKVDAVADAQTPSYTVYVDSTNGLDTNDAYSEETPAKTVEHAFAQLDTYMILAPQGQVGKVVFLDVYPLGDDTAGYIFPSYDYPVIMTSLDGRGGLKRNATSNCPAKYRYICFGGDTVLDNLRLEAGYDNNYFYLFAGNHDLTVNANVNTVETATKGYPFSISAGFYSTDATENCNLTILGGHWKYLYYTNYIGSFDGDVNVVVDGASFQGMMSSYQCYVTSNISVSLKNVTLRDEPIHMGNANARNVTGNVTLTLGENVKVSDIYMGSRTAGNISGTSKLIIDGADLTDVTVHPNAQIEGTIGKTVFAYKSGPVTTITDIYDEVQVYMDGRFYSMNAAITMLSLDASVTGFGYKAAFTCDEAARGLIAQMGYTLWLTEDRMLTKTKAQYQDNLTLRLKNFDVDNYGEAPVNAKVFIQFANGVTVESPVAAYSMRQMVELINTGYSSFNLTQLEAVAGMIEKYETMQSWEVSNLYSAGEDEEQSAS